MKGSVRKGFIPFNRIIETFRKYDYQLMTTECGFQKHCPDTDSALLDLFRLIVFIFIFFIVFLRDVPFLFIVYRIFSSIRAAEWLLSSEVELSLLNAHAL